jgi:hypothetical protein
MILQFLILILILILIHHNDLDHSGAARPGEQGDRHLAEFRPDRDPAVPG